MEILIAGDLVPTSSNMELFNTSNINSLIGNELKNIWDSVDYRIFNLEAPLYDGNNPILKCGPNLKASSSTIKGIKSLNPSLITLANNHIMDHGVDGLESTLNILKTNSLKYIGAGVYLKDAFLPFIFQTNNLKIGVYSCAEHEFSISTGNYPGANPFDPLESLDHIQGLKRKCDFVIVLYHGGKEHYRYPSPNLQKVCRKIVEKGADLVVCQHSHCIGCFEKYLDSTIVYGQGNFIFDHSDSEYWQTSILINVTITDKLNISYIPIIKNGSCISLAEGIIANTILKNFNQRSDEILKEGYIEKKYSEFVELNILSYLKAFSGMSRLLNKIDRTFLRNSFIKKKYNQKRLLALQNYIECESHRELLIKGLKEEIKFE